MGALWSGAGAAGAPEVGMAGSGQVAAAGGTPAASSARAASRHSAKVRSAGGWEDERMPGCMAGLILYVHTV
jgi:hypothetical protein